MTRVPRLVEVYGLEEKDLLKKIGKIGATGALAAACNMAEPVEPTVGKPTPEVDCPTVFIEPDEHGHDHEEFDCELLPDDGPCSLLCDPDELRDQYGVPGACISFHCTLDNGETADAHICASDEDDAKPSPEVGSTTNTRESASVRSLFMLMEDQRSNVKKLLLKPKPLKLDDQVADHVANLFHEIDQGNSFPLVKAFILWATEHGAGTDQHGGHGENEPFRNEPHKGPPMLDPSRLRRMSRQSSEMQQFMREVGHGLVDALKARPNVMPGLVNKATSLADVTQAVGKYQKREALPDKMLMRMPDGWSWVIIDCEEDRRREGEEMQHCATDSRGDLISLRDPQGKPHVTMTYNRGTNTVHQIKGKQNREPEKKYWPAIEAIFGERSIKLKDRWISAELKDALSKHQKKTILAKSPVGNWVEITDGLLALVPAQLGVEVSAEDALISVDMVDSDYSNDFKAVKVRQKMSGSDFMTAMKALLDLMPKVTLDLSKVDVANLTDDGDPQLTSSLDSLIAAGKVSMKRKIKSLGEGMPIVARASIGNSKEEGRYFFDDSSKLLFMKPRASLQGSNSTKGIIVSGMKDVAPGSVMDGIERFDSVIASLNDQLEANKLIFGFELDSWLGQEGGPLVKDVLPQTFNAMAVKAEQK